MSEFAGNLPRKFSRFRHLGFESSAHNLPEERESETPQNVAENVEVNTVVVGETLNSPAKVESIFQNLPKSSEIVTSGVFQKDHYLTIAEKDCVMTSSEEDMDDLNAFVNEKLQFMTAKCLEQLVGDGSMNIEDTLYGSVAAVSGLNVGSVGNVGTEEFDWARTTSLCPGSTLSGNLEAIGCEVSSHERDELDRFLREDFSDSGVTSTRVRGLWPIHSKRDSKKLEGMRHILVNPEGLDWLTRLELLKVGICRCVVWLKWVEVWKKVILLVAASLLWRSFLRNGLMIKMEDCITFRQVMVWFEFRQ